MFFIFNNLEKIFADICYLSEQEITDVLSMVPKSVTK